MVAPARDRYWALAALAGKYVSAAAAGIVLGAIITWAVIERKKGFGSIEAGPWTSWSRVGTADVDPYSRAVLAYFGEAPLSESEGINFVAYGDSSGAGFNAACEYVMTGEVPSARYWTLTLYSPEGAAFATPPKRSGFTSSEVLRNSGGQFEITISRRARPGNWLPSGAAAKFILVLRFYDSEFTSPSGTVDAKKMPALIKGRCE
ncbi:MAG: DUF1214 domain-containing protein [Methylocapsa sp.]|nr:DUF1214 domain-containing protein [Methylocapsa sp.]